MVNEIHQGWKLSSGDEVSCLFSEKLVYCGQTLSCVFADAVWDVILVFSNDTDGLFLC